MEKHSIERCEITCPFCLTKLAGWAIFHVVYKKEPRNVVVNDKLVTVGYTWQPHGKTPNIEQKANEFERKKMQQHLDSSECLNYVISPEVLRLYGLL